MGEICLVTGATGFLGSNVINALLSRGKGVMPYLVDSPAPRTTARAATGIQDLHARSHTP